MGRLIIDADNLILKLWGERSTYEDWDSGKEIYVSLAEVHDVAESLPTIEAEPKWIPTSERLPEVGQWVLCQCVVGAVMNVLKRTHDGDWKQLYPLAIYESEFVVAWMPLPEPYKG